MQSLKRILILEIESDEDYLEHLLKRINEDNSVNFLFDSSIKKFGTLEIDTLQKKLYKNNVLIKLTKSEISILLLLTSMPNRIFSREQIYEAVWNEKSESCIHSVENMISRLRKKIEDDPSKPKYIITVSGFGYKFKRAESD